MAMAAPQADIVCDARLIARMIAMCVPQRHLMPASASRICASVGCGFVVQERGGGHDPAGEAVAALRHLLVDVRLSAADAVSPACRAGERRDALARSRAAPAVTHERTGAPSRCTVQAPHCACAAAELRDCRARDRRAARRAAASRGRHRPSAGLPSTTRLIFMARPPVMDGRRPRATLFFWRAGARRLAGSRGCERHLAGHFTPLQFAPQCNRAGFRLAR